MATVGVWMLVAVGALMVATGLPAWVVLCGVAVGAAAGGLAAGAFSLPLLMLLPSRLVGLLEQDLLQALPLYVLMGSLLHRLPLADILFRAGSRALARTGVAAPLAGLGLGVLLAPMNGSVGASVAMLTRTVTPRLDASGLPPAQGAALVSLASTLGIVVPPSLVLILLADAMLRAHTEAVNATRVAARIINTQDIFRGALVPAALLFALCVVATLWIAAREGKGSLAPVTAVRRGDFAIAAATAMLIGTLLAGVTLGYLYAVEAAATGGVGLVAYGLATGTLTRAVMTAVLRETLAVTGALFALLVGANVFTLVLRAFGTDRWVGEVLGGLAGGPLTALALVLAILALCAFVLDAFELIFVVVPVVMPPLLMRVPDATWVAVLTLLILQGSFLLPPFGYSVLMVRQRLARPLGLPMLARALAPYLAAQLVVLALVATMPALVWRGPPAAVEAGVTPAPLTDDEVRAEFERQLGGGAADGTGPAGK